MKKLFVIVPLMFCLTGLFLPGSAIARGLANPEADTRAFYSWYLQTQSRPAYPLLDKDIYRYVAKQTVDGLRNAWRHNRLPGDSDYFTRVQDYDEADWSKHIVTQTAFMLGDVAIVPVTFGSKDRISVLVFLRNMDGHWKITKIDDTQDYR